MKRLLLLVLLLQGTATLSLPVAAAERPRNFVHILADNVGDGDIRKAFTTWEYESRHTPRCYAVLLREKVDPDVVRV